MKLYKGVSHEILDIDCCPGGHDRFGGSYWLFAKSE
jgi:hypothetical protein